MRNKRYGVPYKGSKNKIVDKLWTAIPTHGADNFYDIFAGGCAVTHKALESGAFDRYYANDLQGDGLRIFCGAIHGDFASETRWIDRDTFFAMKDSDPYVRVCWSFGNNQRDYMYSKEIEPWKKALHWARVYKDTSLLKEFGIDSDGSRADVKAHHEEYKRKYIRWWLERHGPSQSLQSLQRLQSLQSLQSLQRLQSLQTTYKSYDEVEILPHSVIYCDPPYIGTNAYLVGFDHEKFYDWCEKQKELVLVSEYTMPDDRFVPVWSVLRKNTMDRKNIGKVTEKLFVPKRQLQKYHDMMQDGKKPYYVELEMFTEEEYAGRGENVLP